MEEKIWSAIKRVVDEVTMEDEKAIELIKNDDTNLKEVFKLDSFLSVQLIIELEEEFGIEIDMEEIDIEIYEESSKLKDMINSYLEGIE